jgi:soluble lytic murein transglycosylase-like protein
MHKVLGLALSRAILLCLALQASDVYGKPGTEPIPRAAYAYRASLIREARFIWGLEAKTSTFASQVHTESGWRFRARNPSGAAGLGQFIPSTATWMARRYADLRPAQVFSPIWSLRAMLLYDREIYRMTRPGSLCQKMTYTLIGYNYGPARMYRKRLPRETQRYVYQVLKVLEPVYVANGWGLGSCN